MVSVTVYAGLISYGVVSVYDSTFSCTGLDRTGLKDLGDADRRGVSSCCLFSSVVVVVVSVTVYAGLISYGEVSVYDSTFSSKGLETTARKALGDADRRGVSSCCLFSSVVVVVVSVTVYAGLISYGVVSVYDSTFSCTGLETDWTERHLGDADRRGVSSCCLFSSVVVVVVSVTVYAGLISYGVVSVYDSTFSSKGLETTARKALGDADRRGVSSCCLFSSVVVVVVSVTVYAGLISYGVVSVYDSTFSCTGLETDWTERHLGDADRRGVSSCCLFSSVVVVVVSVTVYAGLISYGVVSVYDSTFSSKGLETTARKALGDADRRGVSSCCLFSSVVVVVVSVTVYAGLISYGVVSVYDSTFSCTGLDRTGLKDLGDADRRGVSSCCLFSSVVVVVVSVTVYAGLISYGVVSVYDSTFSCTGLDRTGLKDLGDADRRGVSSCCLFSSVVVVVVSVTVYAGLISYGVVSVYDSTFSSKGLETTARKAFGDADRRGVSSCCLFSSVVVVVVSVTVYAGLISYGVVSVYDSTFSCTGLETDWTERHLGDADRRGVSSCCLFSSVVVVVVSVTVYAGLISYGVVSVYDSTFSSKGLETTARKALGDADRRGVSSCCLFSSVVVVVVSVTVYAGLISYGVVSVYDSTFSCTGLETDWTERHLGDADRRGVSSCCLFSSVVVVVVSVTVYAGLISYGVVSVYDSTFSSKGLETTARKALGDADRRGVSSCCLFSSVVVVVVSVTVYAGLISYGVVSVYDSTFSCTGLDRTGLKDLGDADRRGVSSCCLFSSVVVVVVSVTVYAGLISYGVVSVYDSTFSCTGLDRTGLKDLGDADRRGVSSCCLFSSVVVVVVSVTVYAGLISYGVVSVYDSTFSSKGLETTARKALGDADRRGVSSCCLFSSVVVVVVSVTVYAGLISYAAVSVYDSTFSCTGLDRTGLKDLGDADRRGVSSCCLFSSVVVVVVSVTVYAGLISYGVVSVYDSTFSCTGLDRTGLKDLGDADRRGVSSCCLFSSVVVVVVSVTVYAGLISYGVVSVYDSTFSSKGLETTARKALGDADRRGVSSCCLFSSVVVVVVSVTVYAGLISYGVVSVYDSTFSCTGLDRTGLKDLGDADRRGVSSCCLFSSVVVVVVSVTVYAGLISYGVVSVYATFSCTGLDRTGLKDLGDADRRGVSSCCLFSSVVVVVVSVTVYAGLISYGEVSVYDSTFSSKGLETTARKALGDADRRGVSSCCLFSSVVVVVVSVTVYAGLISYGVVSVYDSTFSSKGLETTARKALGDADRRGVSSCCLFSSVVVVVVSVTVYAGLISYGVVSVYDSTFSCTGLDRTGLKDLGDADRRGVSSCCLFSSVVVVVVSVTVYAGLISYGEVSVYDSTFSSKGLETTARKALGDADRRGVSSCCLFSSVVVVVVSVTVYAGLISYGAVSVYDTTFSCRGLETDWTERHLGDADRRGVSSCCLFSSVVVVVVSVTVYAGLISYAAVSVYDSTFSCTGLETDWTERHLGDADRRGVSSCCLFSSVVVVVVSVTVYAGLISYGVVSVYDSTFSCTGLETDWTERHLGDADRRGVSSCCLFSSVVVVVVSVTVYAGLISYGEVSVYDSTFSSKGLETTARKALGDADRRGVSSCCLFSSVVVVVVSVTVYAGLISYGVVSVYDSTFSCTGLETDWTKGILVMQIEEECRPVACSRRW